MVEQRERCLERTLKNIFRRARTDYQERGVRILYLVFGTLIWKEQEKSEENPFSAGPMPR